ncbi:hypothetical protein F5884DRAFT_117223 [Xylogone sp. PMI_703]|nr:hypothetical protein F5884DRAFT_117223 [Xylogone sp. PMI_703]
MEKPSLECPLCHKTFEKNLSRNRHVLYCRKKHSVEQPSRRRACRLCIHAKTRCDTRSPQCSRCERKQAECVYDGVVPQRHPRSRAIRKDSETAGPGDYDEHSTPTEIASIGPPSGSLPQDAEQSELIDWGPDLLSFTSSEMSLRASPPILCSDDPLTTQTADIIDTDNSIWAAGLLDDRHDENSSSFRLISTSLSAQSSATPFLPPHFTYHDTARVFRPRTFISTSSHRSSTFMIRVLRSYPRMMLRPGTFPPFIHPHYCGGSYDEIHEPTLTEPLAISKSIAQMFTSRTKQNTAFMWRTIRMEQERLLANYLTFEKWEILGGMQALLLYILLRIIEGNPTNTNDTGFYLLSTLKTLCSHLHSLYPDSLNDPSHPTWEDWIFFESRRRTSVVFLLVNMLVDLDLGVPPSGCTPIEVAPLPSMRALWESNSRSAFQRQYNSYMGTHGTDTTYGDLLNWRTQNEGWNGGANEGLDEWCSGMDDLGMLVLAAAALF